MKTQTKIIMFVIIVIVAIVIGLIINLQGFTKIQEDKNEPSITEDVNNKKQDPILELTQDEVVLEVGSTFSYKDFIRKAEDENGFNLKDNVNVPKAVSTDVPGEYQIEYTLELSNGKKISKQLLLKIVEFDLGTNSD